MAQYNLQNEKVTTDDAGNVISSASLQPKPTIQPATPTPDTTDYNGITGGVTQSIINDYASLNAKQQEAQTQQQNTGSDILSYMQQLTNKTADTQAANEAAGVNTETANLNKYVQQLADLNAQASSLNREAQAIPLQVQENNRNTGATDAGVAPQSAGALRLNALKALSIGQQADIAAAAATGSQLRLQAAKDKAQQIVDLKYKPLEDKLAIKQKQYELNKDVLDSIDKKRSEALGVSLQKEAQDLAEKKAQSKVNTDLALTAGVTTKLVNKNGEWFRASDGKPYKDPKELFADFPELKGDFSNAYRLGLVTDVNGATLQHIEFARQAAAKYPDAGITPNMSQAEIAQAIKKNSAIYRRDTYIAPPAGSGPQKGSLAATNIVDAQTDAQVKALIASKPGDGGYGAAYKAVASRFGKAVADSYDKVYQGVFNGGQSVDAAFNNAKLGSNGIDSPGGAADFDILAEAVSNKIGSVASKNSFLNQYKKANSDEQRIKILASNVNLPNEIKVGLIQNTQVTKALEDVLGMLDKGVQTGLLQAGQSYIANKLGSGGDKEVEAIKSKLITAVQPYRNKVTGAAWGDQEEQEYQALLGSVKFSPEDLRNKLNVFKDTLKQQSQTALLTAIDPVGAINDNSFIQNSPQLGGNAGTTTMTGPDGNQYEVPNNQVEAFRKAGGR